MNDSEKNKKYKAHNYILCVMAEGGHRRVFSPDFEIHFSVPVSADPHKWTAITLQQMEVEIESRLKKLEEKGLPHPTPQRWREAIPEFMNVQQAADFLNVSPSTLRRMNLPSQETPGGHRRYSRRDLEAL